MKVALDISVLGSGMLDPKARTGVFRVVENLAMELVRSPECEVSFCAGGESFHPLYGVLRYLPDAPEFAETPFLSAGAGARLSSHLLDRLTASPPAAADAREKAGLLARIGGSVRGRAISRIAGRRFPIRPETVRGSDVFHSPYLPLPRWSERPARCRFLTVYDLIAIRRPDLYEPHVEQHDRAILDSIGPEDFVTCISAATRDDLCDYTGIDPARVFVTPLAASRELFHPCTDPGLRAAVLRRYGLPNDRPYLLALGTLKPGKNFVTTIGAFAEMVRFTRLEDLNLVLVGTRGWDYNAIFDAVKEVGPLKDRIHFTGFVADEDLAAIYSGALAFVFPSILEGFGLPVLEAMQCGVPVVASDRSAIPEVVGDAGILVDPTDVAGYSSALLSLYSDAGLRADLASRALQRSEQFSWARCAAETLAAYRVALAA